MTITFKTVDVSGNRKLGPIASSYTSKESCPESCPLKGSGCYAELGPTLWQWNKTDKDFDQFISWIGTLSKGEIFRHNVAGDLHPYTYNKELISDKHLAAIVQAAERRKLNGFTYTHYKPEVTMLDGDERVSNAKILRAYRSDNFTVNLSANNIQQALEYQKHGLPVVTVVPANFWDDKQGNAYREQNTTFIRCPAEYTEGMNCKQCKACANGNRKSVIAFTAHGSRKKTVSIIAKG